eukprot:c4845_g1_i1.p1 GENE.c4845_g1_i1~~c4845_g1_i1.p1  ORF type:complete len:124 (+),score=34.33 c4845_g1_i1:135-506(+)
MKPSMNSPRHTRLERSGSDHRSPSPAKSPRQTTRPTQKQQGAPSGTPKETTQAEPSSVESVGIASEHHSLLSQLSSLIDEMDSLSNDMASLASKILEDLDKDPATARVANDRNSLEPDQTSIS